MRAKPLPVAQGFRTQQGALPRFAEVYKDCYCEQCDLPLPIPSFVQLYSDDSKKVKLGRRENTFQSRQTETGCKGNCGVGWDNRGRK